MVTYLQPSDHDPATIRKTEKLYGDKLDCKDTTFPGKVRDIHKIETKNSISISVFGNENKKKHPTWVSNKHIDLSKIE